jgi:hypothetical protein
MSQKTYVARQLDALFQKPTDEFKPPMSAPAPKAPTPDPLDALMQKAAAKPGRGLTNQERQERAARRAEYDKKRKEEKRKQMARVKQRVRMTDEEIRAEAIVKTAEKERRRIPRMSDGELMTDRYDDVQVRPTTGGFGPQQMDYMAGMAETSGVSEGGGAKRRVNPEGAGTGESSAEDNATPEFFESGGASVRPVGSFRVQLNVAASERQRIINYAIEEYFVDSVCRLCLHDFETLETAEKHIVSVHGDECEPQHDFDFGDVLGKIARKIKREDQKRRKVARALNPEVALSEEDRLLVKAARRQDKATQSRREGMVQRGWIQVPGGRWVPNWVRDTRKIRKPV